MPLYKNKVLLSLDRLRSVSVATQQVGGCEQCCWDCGIGEEPVCIHSVSTAKSVTVNPVPGEPELPPNIQ